LQGDGPIVARFTGVLDADGILTLDIQTAWLRDNPDASILIGVLQVVVDTNSDLRRRLTTRVPVGAPAADGCGFANEASNSLLKNGRG